MVEVTADHLTIDSYSTVALNDDVTHYGDYSLYANTMRCNPMVVCWMLTLLVDNGVFGAINFWN
ncbi:hypothetical protein KCP71_25755 [Salmonella enterica subsp. enterica]|nr:hypothetical protein KCP71_25755 [Salmonella enterica subsp. enterica]